MEKKEEKSFTYQDAKELSYKYTLYRTGNIHISNEIATRTASKFIFDEIQGSLAGIKSWIYLTSRNYCYEFFREIKKKRKLEEKYKEKLTMDSILEKSEKDTKLLTAFEEAFESLNEEQQRTLALYFMCEKNYVQMEEIAEISAATLRKRISRINKKLKAVTYLNLGMMGTKKIVTPELDNLLYKFLSRFKKNLEDNTLHKMYRYFTQDDLKDYHETFDIKEIDTYEIRINAGEYHIIIVFSNNNDKTETFDFKFKIENHHLKITAPPRKKPIAAIIDRDSEIAREMKRLLHLYPPDRTGKSTIPKELIDALIRKNRSAQPN